MVKKREIKKGELVAADVVESGSYSSKEDEIYSEELKIQRALKYYNGRLKGQVGVVGDHVSLVLDVCREVRDELGKLSECSVNKISDLAFECLKVTADRDALKAAYEDLESEFEDMKTEYEGLKEKFGDLVEESDSLKERVSSLEGELKEKTLWRCLKEKFHFA